MAPFLLLLTVITYTNQALHIVDSNSQNITCNADDDCFIDCRTNCTQKPIRCQSGYACTIDCGDCNRSNIYAFEVTNLDITCDHCFASTLHVTLSQIDSQFNMVCAPSGCQNMQIIVDHTENTYNLAMMSDTIDYTTYINCHGSDACRDIHVDSTINGHFAAICNGSYACIRGVMLYNPPINNEGNMTIQCRGNNACWSVSMMALSARQIYMDCPSINITQAMGALPAAQGCTDMQITGPVLPFDKNADKYALTEIYKDSVVLQCTEEGWPCYPDWIDVYVPFGQFQTYLQDWNQYGTTYGCGWDYGNGDLSGGAGGEWEYPSRDIGCSSQFNKHDINGMVLGLLQEGANIIVTNKYNESHTCQNGKHCLVYSMNSRSSQIAEEIKINCPTDAVSHCYVLAMRAQGLSNVTVNGTLTRLLLLKGYDRTTNPAHSAFRNAEIYGPEGEYVNNGILTLPASNAQYSFEKAQFYVENTPIIVIAKIDMGLMSAEIFANNVRNNFLYIQCNFASMCQNMQVYIDNPSYDSFNFMPESGNHERYMCWMCAPHNQDGCASARLYITDTSNLTAADDSQYYMDTLFDDQSGSMSNWILLSGAGQDIEGTYDIQTINYECMNDVLNLLNNTWFEYNAVQYLSDTNAPQQCDYAMMHHDMYGWLSYEYRPPVTNYCFHTKVLALPYQFWTFEQACVNGELVFKHYYNNDPNDTTCSGEYSIVPNDPNGLVHGDCTVQNNLCEYATYTIQKYATKEAAGAGGTDSCEEFAFEREVRNAVFVGQCMPYDGIGEYYTCDGDTLTLNRYNDTFNCSGVPFHTVVYKEDTCIDSWFQNSIFEGGRTWGKGGLYVTNITCFGGPTPEPTTAPTPVCLSLDVDVIDDQGIFDEADFDGIYTQNAVESQWDAPLWEKIQDSHNQHVRYYGGQWIIHGKGYNVLSYKSNARFVPWQDLSANWSYSKADPTQAFKVWITCINTYAPTAAPTDLPTFSPTKIPNTPSPVLIIEGSPTRANEGQVRSSEGRALEDDPFIFGNEKGSFIIIVIIAVACTFLFCCFIGFCVYKKIVNKKLATATLAMETNARKPTEINQTMQATNEIRSGDSEELFVEHEEQAITVGSGNGTDSEELFGDGGTLTTNGMSNIEYNDTVSKGNEIDNDSGGESMDEMYGNQIKTPKSENTVKISEGSI